MQCTRQDEDSWLTELSKVISQGESYSLDGIAVYAFGSYAKTPTGRDVDLLIIYDKGLVALPEALDIRRRIARRVTEKTRKQSHICMLSNDEPERLVFIREEKGKIIIGPRRHTGPTRHQ